jgi:hypothetical protein
MRTLALVLAGNNTESKVILDGFDISDACHGVEVEAFIGQPTRVTLHLLADCRLMADMVDVEIEKPEQ